MVRRQRMRTQKSINFTDKMIEKIQGAADQFNVSFADIVRECIDKELPRLIAREHKRQQYQKNVKNKDST